MFSVVKNFMSASLSKPEYVRLCSVGFIVGLVMTLSNYGFMAALLAFFIAGSKLTKWRSSYKRKFEADFKEG